MNPVKNIGILPLALLLVSCVTINIYFPAAEAEEAARTIVRDVLGATPDDAPNNSSEQSRNGTGHATRFAGLVLDTLITPAQAQAADINIGTPKIKQIRGTLKARQGQLAAFYKSGAIGLGNNGLVKMHDAAKVALKDRNTLKKLLADENRDRNALYAEIARANGHPEWEADIRKTFARVWAQEAPAGTWKENAGGQWSQ